MADVIASVGNTQLNETGSGTTYTINWDGTLYDDSGFWNSNNFTFDSQRVVTITPYIKLSGLSALNTLFSLYLNTTDGSIPFYTLNASSLLLSGTYDLCITNSFVLNPNNTTGYTVNLQIQVSNGLTDTVDILSGSTLYLST
jgi:hypothetical protein